MKRRQAKFFNGLRLVSLLFLMICIMNISSTSATQPLTGVIKCIIPWQVAFSNSTVSFDLSIWNPSYFYDTLKLDIRDPGLPEGWKAHFYFQNKKVREIGIERRGKVSLTVVIEIPEDAVPRDYQFTVHADGEYSRSEITLSVTVESPPITYEVDLYSPHEWQATFPGNSAAFELYLKNKCPKRDNYLIYVENPSLPENWTATFLVGDKAVSYTHLTLPTTERV